MSLDDEPSRTDRVSRARCTVRIELAALILVGDVELGKIAVTEDLDVEFCVAGQSRQSIRCTQCNLPVLMNETPVRTPSGIKRALLRG
jgi:hypothetical protein